MAKEVTVLGIEGAFLRGVRLEERNGAFVCTEVESWPLVAGAADGTSAAAVAGETPATPMGYQTAIPMGNPPATPMGSLPASPIGDQYATSADFSEEAPVEAVAEEDKPLARALRAAAKHFEQSEFSLAIPLSKLLVKGVRMPVEARDELLSAAKLELDGISPFPDEDLAPAAEVVAETDSEIQVLAAALPAAAASEIGAALTAARVHVTRTDATALGWLRSLWPRLSEVEAHRRLVLLNLGDGWDLAVLDDGAPVQLRGIGNVGSSAELVREVTLSLLACDAGGADVGDVAVCGFGLPDKEVLARLSVFGPVRTLIVDNPSAGVEGCAQREAEGGTFDVTPADWAEARTESRFRGKLKVFLAVAIGLWAVVMGVLFGYEIVYNKMRDHQKDLRKGAHARAYKEVLDMTNRVALIDRYEDRSTCALEMLKLVSDSLPDDEGMTFDFFRFRRGDGVFVRGKASERESWRKLEQALRATQVAKVSEDGEVETDEDAPALFSEVKPSDSSQNRDGLFPFTIEAKFPVVEEDKAEKGRSK